MKKNSKSESLKITFGFTLIELLAVIILLGLIALIVYPKVKDTLDESRQKAFVSSVQGLYDAVNQDYVKNGLIGNSTYKYDNKKLIKIEENGIINSEEIELDGKIEEGSGEVYVDSEGHIGIAIQNDQYCAYTTLGNKEIKLIEGICPDNVIAKTEESCFNFDSGTITDYNADTCGTNVTIPSTINGIKVERIGNEAFSYCDLISVSIPSSVISIGNSAFESNQLASIIIPSSVTSIGTHAFDLNQLADVTIPNSVTSIGAWAFAGNKLMIVTLGSNVETIDESAFLKIDNTNDEAAIVSDNNTVSILAMEFSNNRATNINLMNNNINVDNNVSDSKGLVDFLSSNHENYYASRPLTGNPITTIYNNSGNIFEWSSITGSSTANQSFVTGTIIHQYGNITVTTNLSK